MNLEQEISKRRTFGIISHPDAGKTTLTEKLLLFGGAIQKAGAVKSSKIKSFFLPNGDSRSATHVGEPLRRNVRRFAVKIGERINEDQNHLFSHAADLHSLL
jgi:hypothetical protein